MKTNKTKPIKKKTITKKVKMTKEKSQPVVDIDLGEFDLKKLKAKTTIYLDGDLWDRIHEDAEKAGMKYQPYLNQLLRKVVLNEKSDLELRVERLEALVKNNKAG